MNIEPPFSFVKDEIEISNILSCFIWHFVNPIETDGFGGGAERGLNVQNTCNCPVSLPLSLNADVFCVE